MLILAKFGSILAKKRHLKFPQKTENAIFDIVAKFVSILAKRGHFLNFPKKVKTSFFDSRDYSSSKKKKILMRGSRKQKCKKPQFLEILGQKDQFCSDFGQFSEKINERFQRKSVADEWRTEATPKDSNDRLSRPKTYKKLFNSDRHK